MIALDTNVVSELLRPRPAMQVRQWVDDQGEATLVVTVVTVAELLFGAARLPDGARKAQLSLAIRAVVHEELRGLILPYDGAAADHFADLASHRERIGRPIGIADAQIAAICRARDAALATRNIRDFEATGVSLLDPWATSAG